MTDKQITQIESQDTTISKEFKPTPHMIVWLDTAIQTGEHVIDHIAEKSGIEESSYYRWIKDPEFVKWYDDEWNKRLKANRWKLDAIGLKQAPKDHKYWESMQRRVGNIQDTPKNMQQINVGGDLGNVITFVNFKDESKG